MSILVLNLRDVPDDEADEVRALLAGNAIEFFETRPNRWGFSAGGIWLQHDVDRAAAHALLAEYQHERSIRAKAEYEAARRDGAKGNLWTELRQRPAQVVGALLAVAALIALTTIPYLWLR